ncbi:MAG: hypothetical protein JRH20_07920 [Deltaproteobacteria bacterium]|nr:hypothetical protein [Deltaproteobacteria bacterium]
MALKRTIALLLAAALLLGAVLMGRMLYSAHEELDAADSAIARGDDEAVDRHLRRAMAHYAPGNIWVATAARRLLNRAKEAERLGKSELALQRYHALHSALLSLRPFQPLGDLSPRVQRRISALTANHQTEPSTGPMQPEQPHPGWTLVGLMGFLFGIGSVFALIAFGFNPDLTLLRGRFWALLAATGGGLCLFCLGMVMA